MNTPVNRRSFLKGAAAASATIGILKPQTVFGAAANSAIRLGIIGCGGRGTADATSMTNNTDIRVAAIADLLDDKLQKGKAVFNKLNSDKGYPPIDDSHLFVGPKAYLRLLEQKDIDAVLVSSPAFFHPEHLEAAVDAGKHVYCEKPVAIDTAGIKQVQRAGIKAEGRSTLAVGFQIRHATPYVEMVKRIQRGDIGDIVNVQAYYFAGSIPVTWYPNAPYDEARIRAWFWFTALSGDILVEQGIHVIDICNWTLKGHPLKAVGSGGRKGRTDNGDVWSHYQVLLEYPGGIHVNFESTQYDPGYGDVCVRFFGTKGIAEAHYTGGVFIKGQNEWDSGVARGTADTISKEQWAAGTFKSSLEDADPNKQKAFAESIRTGKLINEATAGAESALTAILARTASYSGRETLWDEVANSYDRLDPQIDLAQFDRKK
ncbi:Gfo/Idh/MocA family oxidoreductase [bacterium]|nr:Gfo/Idh/MocA family oxidoreductase [bacterium]